MDVILIMLSVLVIVMVNVWHAILLRIPSSGDKPQTISHHAVSNGRSLKIHRAVHAITSVILALYGILYLLPAGYDLAAALIVAAAIFDILEVVTLNKRTASDVALVNSHSVTAWAMALSYLLYATIIIPISGLSTYVVVLVWGLFALLFAVAAARKFKSFWITQHMYFSFLAFVMIVAHLQLLP